MRSRDGRRGGSAGRGSREIRQSYFVYYNAQAATIVRSNNVMQVTSPSAGTYCITPVKPVDALTVYPVVSAEYITSRYVMYAGSAVWQDTTVASDCAAGDLEVRTVYNGVLQQSIGFSLVVFQ
jgi:hypothetical protein